MNKEIQKLVDSGEMLPLMEEFYTIQGEGYHKGTGPILLELEAVTLGVTGVMLRKAGMPNCIHLQLLIQLLKMH